MFIAYCINITQILQFWKKIFLFPLKDMDGLHSIVAVFCMLFAFAEGFNSGPPVSVPDVCNDMFPSGHGASAQASTDMVTITLGNDCYNDSHIIPGQFDFVTVDGPLSAV